MQLCWTEQAWHVFWAANGQQECCHETRQKMADRVRWRCCTYRLFSKTCCVRLKKLLWFVSMIVSIFMFGDFLLSGNMAWWNKLHAGIIEQTLKAQFWSYPACKAESEQNLCSSTPTQTWNRTFARESKQNIDNGKQVQHYMTWTCQQLCAQEHRLQKRQQSSEWMLSGTHAHTKGDLPKTILCSNIMHESMTDIQWYPQLLNFV